MEVKHFLLEKEGMERHFDHQCNSKMLSPDCERINTEDGERT